MHQSRRTAPEVATIRRQYLHVFAALACVIPFISYVLADDGWSASDIGLAAAAITVGGVVMAPVWGRLDALIPGGAVGLALRCTGLAALLLAVASWTQSHFWVFATATIFGAASGSIDPLITARAFENAVSARRLGAARSGGSIGWVVGLAAGAGILSLVDHPASVFVLAAIAAVTTPVRPAAAGPDPRPEPVESSKRTWQVVAGILSITLPATVAIAVLVTFTAGWAHTELSAGPFMSVGPLALSAALEVPAFQLVDRVASRIRSETLAALAYPPIAVAALILSVAPGQMTLFAIQPLVATTFAFTYVAQGRLVAERSLTSLMPATQALVSASGRAIATPAAGVIGGAIAAAAGYSSLFLAVCLLGLLGGVRAALA